MNNDYDSVHSERYSLPIEPIEPIDADFDCDSNPMDNQEIHVPGSSSDNFGNDANQSFSNPIVDNDAKIFIPESIGEV